MSVETNCQLLKYVSRMRRANSLCYNAFLQTKSCHTGFVAALAIKREHLFSVLPDNVTLQSSPSRIFPGGRELFIQPISPPIKPHFCMCTGKGVQLHGCCQVHSCKFWCHFLSTATHGVQFDIKGVGVCKCIIAQ